MIDEEDLGGDPPCWAHLFDDAMGAGADGSEAVDATGTRAGAGDPVDLAAEARAARVSGAIWTNQSEDLNANLLVFTSGEGVGEHVNTEVDVLLVGIAGEGVVQVDGSPRVLSAGHALVVPKGVSRSTQGLSNPFAYLTCHRRRAGLWPSRDSRSASPRGDG